jgi:hypothetical protein
MSRGRQEIKKKGTLVIGMFLRNLFVRSQSSIISIFGNKDLTFLYFLLWKQREEKIFALLLCCYFTFYKENLKNKKQKWVNSINYIDILHRIFTQALHCQNIRPHYNNLITLQEVSPLFRAPDTFMCYIAFIKLHEIINYDIWVTNSDKSLYQDSWDLSIIWKVEIGKKRTDRINMRTQARPQRWQLIYSPFFEGRTLE